jgi:hypothetical protein
MIYVVTPLCRQPQVTSLSWPGRRLCPRASFATRTRPTTREPNFEDGLQAAAWSAD